MSPSSQKRIQRPSLATVAGLALFPHDGWRDGDLSPKTLWCCKSSRWPQGQSLTMGSDLHPSAVGDPPHSGINLHRIGVDLSAAGGHSWSSPAHTMAASEEGDTGEVGGSWCIFVCFSFSHFLDLLINNFSLQGKKKVFGMLQC